MTQRVEAPYLRPLLVPRHRSLEVISRLIDGHRAPILGDRVLPAWVDGKPGGHDVGKP